MCWRAVVRSIAFLAGGSALVRKNSAVILTRCAKAWTARHDIHWIVPSLAGIPYGMGIDITFMALNNYLTDAYGVYSASALASSVFSRNVVAALLLPLVTYQMFEQLGVGWACSVLGFLCAALSPIPLIMIKYGPILRARSPFCQQLKQKRCEGEQAEL